MIERLQLHGYAHTLDYYSFIQAFIYPSISLLMIDSGTGTHTHTHTLDYGEVSPVSVTRKRQISGGAPRSFLESGGSGGYLFAVHSVTLFCFDPGT